MRGGRELGTGCDDAKGTRVDGETPALCTRRLTGFCESTFAPLASARDMLALSPLEAASRITWSFHISSRVPVISKPSSVTLKDPFKCKCHRDCPGRGAV